MRQLADMQRVVVPARHVGRDGRRCQVSQVVQSASARVEQVDEAQKRRHAGGEHLTHVLLLLLLLAVAAVAAAAYVEKVGEAEQRVEEAIEHKEVRRPRRILLEPDEIRAIQKVGANATARHVNGEGRECVARRTPVGALARLRIHATQERDGLALRHGRVPAALVAALQREQVRKGERACDADRPAAGAGLLGGEQIVGARLGQGVVRRVHTQRGVVDATATSNSHLID